MQDRIYYRRLYEGEWWFVCQPPCKGYIVEYSFCEIDRRADRFLTLTGTHSSEICHLCLGTLEWAGFSGDMPISDSLISLIKSEHFMAATVILAAVTENLINNLLWASLIDSGVDRQRANAVANGRLGRFDSLNIIKSLSGLQIPDISFPVRNLVAHGKGFGKHEAAYKEDLRTQIAQIVRWTAKIWKGRTPKSFMPTEIERWLLFLGHWTDFLENYVGQKLLT